MKRAKWFLIVLAVVIALLGVVVFMWNIQPRNRLAKYVAQLEAEGAVLEVAHLRSTRPEGTTFYSGPIEESATAFLLSPEAAGPDSGVNPMDWPWFETSKMADKVFELTPEEEAEVRAVVEENRDLIMKLKEIGDLAPTRMEDIIELTGLDGEINPTKCPDLRACDGFASLLMLDAYVAQQDGQADDALQTCGDILQLAGHVRDIPGLVPQMIGIAMTAMVTEAGFLPRSVQDADFSDEAVASFAAVLDQSTGRETFAQAFDAELLFGRQIFAEMRGEEYWQMDTLEERGQKAIARVIVLPFTRLMVPHNELAWLSITRDCQAAAKLPYHHARDTVARIEQTVMELGWTTFVTKIAVPNLTRNFAAQAENEVRLAQTKIALALNRHKRDNGGYPDDLNALVPAYLPEVPVDVFSGNEMLYFRTNGSYVLYSAGWDGKDHLPHYRTGEVGEREPSADEVRLPPPDGLIWGRWRAFPRASQ
jgi:hypothetical protein